MAIELGHLAQGGLVRRFRRFRATVVAVPAVLGLLVAGSAVASIMNLPNTATPDVPVATSVQKFSVEAPPGDASSTPEGSGDQPQLTRGGGYSTQQVAGTSDVQWPLTSRDQRITDGFGPRIPPCAVCSSNHRGQDFAGTEGEPVAAIANGKVVEVVPVPGASTLGAYIVLEHQIDGKTVHSVYAHLVSGSVTVRVGDEVATGMQIGKLGNTGASTGPHLHLEILVNRLHVDPLAFLRTYADGNPVKIHTLPEIEWGGTVDGVPRDDAAEGWQPPAQTPGVDEGIPVNPPGATETSPQQPSDTAPPEVVDTPPSEESPSPTLPDDMTAEPPASTATPSPDAPAAPPTSSP